MDVSSVNSSNLVSQLNQPKKAEEKETKSLEETLLNPKAEEPAAVFEKSVPEKSTQAYSSSGSKVNTRGAALNMMAESDRKINQFREMITGMLGKQAGSSDRALFNKKSLEEMVSKASPAQIAQARKDVEKGGYYSEDAVTDRIMSMAEALAGGDESKISVLRKAVEKGFKEAESIYGGQLPEISQNTYKKVMDRFDKWEGKSSDDE